MKDLVKTLAEMECVAGSLYADAAEYFSENEEVSSFLRSLEQDEIIHYDLMNRIDDMIHENAGEFFSSIVLDPKTREELERPILRFREHITGGILDRFNLMDLLVDIEYSEWNHLFLYVIDTLKDHSPDFQQFAAQLEGHKWKIARFMEGKPEFESILKRIRDLKRMWDIRVLVVDDEPALVKLFKSFLEDRYEVDSAQDGNEALMKIQSGYYDAIIMDVDLPFRTGIEVCLEALKDHPDIGKRIIFFTGNSSDEYRAFFSGHGIQYLQKPASLDVIEQRLEKILGRDHTGRS